MGQRISYFKNKSGKALKELIIDNFPAFKLWYLEQVKSSKEAFNESYGNKVLENYLQQKNALTINFIASGQQLIDELTAEFIANYCDSTIENRKLLAPFGPTLSKWRFDESTEMVLQTGDKQLIQLWNYIYKGRSVKDTSYFNSYTNDPIIGFLAFEECLLLQAKIASYFHNPEQISPQSQGLEYVLQVLNEIAIDKTGLIIIVA